MKRLMGIVTIILLAACVFAAADATYWVAIKGGYGQELSGLGGGAEFRHRFIGASGGVGMFAGMWGYDVTAKLHLGRKLRSFWLGGGYGVVGACTDWGWFTVTEQYLVYGWYWLAGGTFISKDGFLFDASFGMAYAEVLQDSVGYPTLNLSVGYALLRKSKA